MAGDWIKLEHATLDKPEVLHAAEMLNMHRREALGLFAEFWIWLDKNLSEDCPNFVRHMSKKSLDEVLHVQGFSSVLEVIGWAKFDAASGTLHVIHAERHNGKPAKTRALDAKRKKEERRKMSGSNPDESRTREEKRREVTPIVPKRFAEFWECYPGPRKNARTKCEHLWASKNFDPLADRILSHVALMAVTAQWQESAGRFVPAPLTYLNQQRWEDGAPTPPSPRLAV